MKGFRERAAHAVSKSKYKGSDSELKSTRPTLKFTRQSESTPEVKRKLFQTFRIPIFPLVSFNILKLQRSTWSFIGYRMLI